MKNIFALVAISILPLTFACESAPDSAPTPASAQPKAAAKTAASSAPTKGAEGVLVSGSITLPQGQAAKGQAVFVSIRSLAGGPPLAAKRMAVGEFPMSFALDSSNLVSMGGSARPTPAEFNVKVTLDEDGNPMNKSAGDLSFVQKVKRGQKDVKMALKKN